MTELLRLTPNESLTVLSAGPEALEVEATYGSGGSPPPKHLHPGQDERFRVLEGVIRARLGDSEHELRAGDELEVPRGSVHQIWNPGEAPARVSWVTTPPGRTVEWFRSVAALAQQGGEVRMPSPLGFAVLVSEYPDTFRLAVGPDALVRAAIAVLAAVGRLRGYRAT